MAYRLRLRIITFSEIQFANCPDNGSRHQFFHRSIEHDRRFAAPWTELPEISRPPLQDNLNQCGPVHILASSSVIVARTAMKATFFGQRLRDRMPADLFKKAVLVVVWLSGLGLVYKKCFSN
jgi:hypothetical protein